MREWALGLFFVGACGDAGSLAWGAHFEDTTLEGETEVLGLSIRRGTCEARSDVVYAETLRRGEDGSTPPELPAGDYVFAATASSERCGVFATACQEISLPIAKEKEQELVLDLVLRATPSGLEHCPDLGGTDAGVDATMARSNGPAPSAAAPRT